MLNHSVKQATIRPYGHPTDVWYVHNNDDLRCNVLDCVQFATKALAEEHMIAMDLPTEIQEIIQRMSNALVTQRGSFGYLNKLNHQAHCNALVDYIHTLDYIPEDFPSEDYQNALGVFNGEGSY